MTNGLIGGAVIALLGVCALQPVRAAPVTAYVAELDVSLPAKRDAKAIDVYEKGEKLVRPSAIIGSLAVASDGRQSKADLVALARSTAAEHGADYVIIAEETTRTKVHSDPTFASAIPLLGGAISVARAGDVDVQKIPAIVFGIGAYNRSVLGVQWNMDARKQQRFVIADFNSYSPMPRAGFQAGDEILEINGMNPWDKRVRTLLAVSPPGTTLKLYVKRGADHLSLDVATVAPP